MANLDIYNFTTLSSIQDGDYLLLAQSSGANGKVTYSLTKNKIKNEIEPTIVNGVWYIGGVSTNIIATGQTPTLRNAGGQIEWKYTNEPDTAYRPLVLISDLKGADGDNIELLATTDYIQWKPTSGTTWMNLIAIPDLKGANGAAVGLRVSNGYIQYNVDGITEWTNIISVSELKGDTGDNIELQTTSTAIQWRVVGTAAWTDLIALSELKGTKGDTGSSGVVVSTTEPTETGVNLWINPDANSNPPQMFIDAWDTVFKAFNIYTNQYEVFGSYNAATGYFEANGLIDITYEQAREILYTSSRKCSPGCEIQTTLRTNVCKMASHEIGAYGLELNQSFYNSRIEAIRLNATYSRIGIRQVTLAFKGCTKLKRIYGILDFTHTTLSIYYYPFFECNMLEYVLIHALKLDIEFASSSNLNKESIIYMLTNRANAVDKTITITLHATAYAKYSVDADVTALLAATTTQGAVNLASA